MSFGLRFINANNEVTLDSEFARLVVLQRGNWNAGGGVGRRVVIALDPVVTTEEPPLIFVRPNASTVFQFCLVNGSSGNWTSFSFTTSNTPGGNWFSAAFKSVPVASYGLRLWSATSTLLFDSGTPCAKFTNYIAGWSFLGTTQISPGRYRYTWSAGTDLNSGQFMMLNCIAMDMAGTQSRQGSIAATWDSGGSRIVLSAEGVDLPSAQYRTIIFGKPEI